MTKTRKLTLTAVFTASSFALMLISKQLPAPWLQGGSITIASMVPIILASVLLGTKWGLASGFIYSLIQMITGFYLPPVTTFLNFSAVIFLDYILPFTCLGLANLFIKLTGNKIWSVPVSGAIVTTIRYIMHIFSGILVWGAFVETDSVILYSVLYNGSYMLPEIIITTVALSFIAPVLKKYFNS